MPTLPAEERLKRLEPLDLRHLNVTPSAAVARLELDGTPGRLWIAMLDRLRGFAERGIDRRTCDAHDRARRQRRLGLSAERDPIGVSQRVGR
jgi:hypothetical protein